MTTLYFSSSPKTVPESLNTNESNNTASTKESLESSAAASDCKPSEKATDHATGAKSLSKAEEVISQTVCILYSSLLLSKNDFRRLMLFDSYLDKLSTAKRANKYVVSLQLFFKSKVYCNLRIFFFEKFSYVK